MDSASDNKVKQASAGVKGKPKARAGRSSKVVQVNKVSDESALSDLMTPNDDEADFPATKKIKINRNALAPSDSSDIDEASTKQATSVYEAKPTKGIFNNKETLNMFIDDFVTSSNERRPDLPAILRSASEIRSLKTKLNKIPLRKFHFTQFSYKTPIRLAVVTNMYGAFVNTMEAFKERQEIFDMTHLQPKHRVYMLLPSANHWWHEESKLLMRESIDSKLVNDMKHIMTTDHFTEGMNKFGLDMRQCWVNFREKILLATRATNEGMVPGVFNVKIPNSQTTPSKIYVELMEFRDPNKHQCDVVKWKRLVLELKYVHAFAVLSISGFKMTRTGLSLDTEVEFLSFANIPSELQRPNIDQRSVVPKKFAFACRWVGTGDPDPSDDEDGGGASAANKTYDKSDLDKYFEY